jgi:hypothetical protein
MRRQDENDGHGSHGRVFNSISFWPGVPFLSPDCAIFRDGGRQSLEEQPTMDKVVSLLISVGIITFGAWVAAATIGRSLRPGSCSMFSGKREWRGASASSKKVKKRIEE